MVALELADFFVFGIIESLVKRVSWRCLYVFLRHSTECVSGEVLSFRGMCFFVVDFA
jgi:hypothetical protein